MKDQLQLNNKEIHNMGNNENETKESNKSNEYAKKSNTEKED